MLTFFHISLHFKTKNDTCKFMYFCASHISMRNIILCASYVIIIESRTWVNIVGFFNKFAAIMSS